MNKTTYRALTVSAKNCYWESEKFNGHDREIVNGAFALWRATDELALRSPGQLAFAVAVAHRHNASTHNDISRSGYSSFRLTPLVALGPHFAIAH